MSEQAVIEFDPHPSQESGDIRENAQRWMTEHPDAMTLLEHWAISALTKGRRVGMKALAERLRWEYAIERGDNAFAVNNSHVSYIARELVGRRPILTAVLSFRRTKYEKE